MLEPVETLTRKFNSMQKPYFSIRKCYSLSSILNLMVRDMYINSPVLRKLKHKLNHLFRVNNMEKQKINIYDILYIILMFMLMDNRLSLAPQSLPFKMFIYQIASCVIILFSLIIFRKIYIPLQIMLVYFLVLIQSGLVILTGRTYTNTIIREDIQLILLLIFVIVIYNYFLRSPVKFLKIFKYAFYFWCISALMFETAYFVLEPALVSSRIHISRIPELQASMWILMYSEFTF